jgi:hypothetical protein
MTLAGNSGSLIQRDTPKCFVLNQPLFQVQVHWLFLHASLVLGALRLTFEAFPGLRRR